MTSMFADGETRVYFLPKVDDPAAPTAGEIAAGTELTGAGGWTMADEGLEITTAEARFSLQGETVSYYTLELSFDATTFIHALRVAASSVRAFRRMMRKHRRRCRACNPAGNPRPLRVDGAAYARRRKARTRRR